MMKSGKFVKHQTKEEYAYEALRSAILNCNLKPGEKIVLDNLSENLGMSPIPVRTALQRLQSEGLVDITPHTGTIVSEISPEQIAQVFLLLELLESAAFELASRKATEEDIAHLRRMLDDMEQCSTSGDSEKWAELNGKFHRYVAGITKMELLIEFTGRTLDSWDRLRRWYLRNLVARRMSSALKDHRQMVDLFARHDITALTKLAGSHNRRARADYAKLISRGTWD